MLKAIIIDDETKARFIVKELLENHCAADVEVIAMCGDVPSAIPIINKQSPDIVFCDIEMPDYSGFELLDFFKKVDFELVFVTAHSEYAARAFESSAIDYLLKPVRIDRLEATIEIIKQKQKTSNMHDRIEALKSNLKGKQLQKVALPVSDGLMFVEIDDISYMEADGAYTHVWINDGKNVIVSKRLKLFDELLTVRPSFVRTHRSFLINLDYMQKYNRNEGYILMDSGINIKVSRERKPHFEKTIEDMKV